MSNRDIWRLLLITLMTGVMTACHGTNQKEIQGTTEPYTSKKVFVLLVNPRSQNEGIYTISNENKQQVLMFESQEDATRYNELLAKQNFAGLLVEEIRQWEVDEFCKAQHYECKLITKGTQVVPPRENAATDFLPKQNKK